MEKALNIKKMDGTEFGRQELDGPEILLPLPP